MVSANFPLGQEFRGAESSMMTTMSPGEKLHLMLVHFCRSWGWGRYSLLHLFQNKSAIYWTCLHLRRAYMSSFWNSPGGKDGLAFRSKRWFGVNASRSFVSVEALVIGRLLRTASASHKNVWRPSSSRCCTCRVELRTLYTDLTFPRRLHDGSQQVGWRSSRFPFGVTYHGFDLDSNPQSLLSTLAGLLQSWCHYPIVVLLLNHVWL